MAITTAKSLAIYIIDRYKDMTLGEEISPIKLQKALYFCFAYWGGFVRKGKRLKSELSEINVNDLEENLFDNKIEAWIYGPVIPEVYREFRDGTLENASSDDIFKGHFFEKSYIDGILDDVLRASDFSLVEESHKDKCWKDNFDFKELMHSNEIPKEQIINEYSYK